jgi:uncharacterized protein
MTMSEHPNAAIVRSAYEAMETGDMPAFVALLDDDIIWHESTPGFVGNYRGRDQVLALLGSIMQETGVQMGRISIHDVLASDDHTVILHETALTKNGRAYTAQYCDVYHLRNGKLTEHWHLAVDPKADEEFLKS